MEDFDEAVEAGREASRHHRKHQQRLFGRHRNSFRLPSSVGWDLLLQVVPFCMFCGSNQRHWIPLLICGSLWRRQSRRDPSRKRPSNQQKNSFVLHEVVRNKNLPGHSLHEKKLALSSAEIGGLLKKCATRNNWCSTGLLCKIWRKKTSDVGVQFLQECRRKKRRSVKNGRMVLLRPLAIVAMFSFAPKAASGCRFLRMEVWIQHRQYVSLRLRSCFLFSEIAVQRPFYLLYIFSSASVGENIPKPARLHLFLGCRHRQAAGGRESFFLPPEGLFS